LGNPTIITNTLLEFGKTIDPKELFPVVDTEAANFVIGNPYAFCIATSLERGTKAEIIWTIPYDIYQLLGHLDPFRIVHMSLEGVANLLSRLPRKPRYINDAPRTIKELTEMIVHDFNGDASLIWKGHNASYINKICVTVS